MLYYLRCSAGSLKQLQNQFNVSKSFCSRELRHSIPCLYSVVPQMGPITLPVSWDDLAFHWGNRVIHFAVDCTSHFRNRIHPGSAMLYRSDKHGFFLTAQCVVSIKYRNFLSVFIAKGHNNDQGLLFHFCFIFTLTGAWSLSKIQNSCTQFHIAGLGDGAYHSPNIYTPKRLCNSQNDLQYNITQRSIRAIVETLQGLVQCWSAAGDRVSTQNLQLHGQALMSCYHLEQMKLLAEPPFAPPHVL